MIYSIWECKQQEIQIEINLNGFRFHCKTNFTLFFARSCPVFLNKVYYSINTSNLAERLVEEIEELQQEMNQI